jgi:F-box and WD-40 domain protein 1/11
MTRVFPISDWAPAQEARIPINGLLSSDLHSPEYGHSASTIRRRSRLMSLPFGSTDLSDRITNLSISEDQDGTVNERREGGGIRNLIRRASVSIRNRQRRHSHTTEERPSTSGSTWNRLRQATSFSRNSRVLPPHFDAGGPVDSCEELGLPIPGYAGAPPVIPFGSGSAARATAAAQNEFLNKHRQLLVPDDKLHNDRESGIGIALAESSQFEDTSISTVDFISALPAELSIQILAHLDHHSLVNVGLVSHKWAQVAASQHVWREAFLREKARTYAMSKPITPGVGLGIPAMSPNTDWKDLYRIRQELEGKWNTGKAEPIYLIGHLDSIYCIQFDEYVYFLIEQASCSSY